MEKDRTSKIIAMVALVVAIVGLSLGFAAFSKQLTITPGASVSASAEDSFSVKFSTVNTGQTEGDVKGTPGGEDGATAEDATLAQTTISGLKAKFTKANQTVTYKFYVHNDGEMDAYLTGINFSNPNPTCAATSAQDTNTELVEAACSHLKVSVKIDTETYSNSNAAIKGKTLSKDSYKEVTVEIKNDETATPVDGEFTADFGSITLTYKSKDNA